jgi:protein Tex
MNSLIDLLSQKTGLTAKTVTNILKLLEEGSTIPFIARYRKEMTGGATDEQLREFESIYGYSKKLLDRKEEVARLIAERSELSNELAYSVEQRSNAPRGRRYLPPF